MNKDSQTTLAEHGRCAAEHHTNLTIFAAVVSLMEGGHLYGSSPHKTAEKIISLCKKEQQRQLKLYGGAIHHVRD